MSSIRYASVYMRRVSTLRNILKVKKSISVYFLLHCAYTCTRTVRYCTVETIYHKRKEVARRHKSAKNGLKAMVTVRGEKVSGEKTRIKVRLTL